MKGPMSGVAGAILIFLIVVGVIFALLNYFEVIAAAIVLLGSICVIVIILGIIIIGIIMIIAMGYFMATKDPEVQQAATYKLEDTIDSKERDREG